MTHTRTVLFAGLLAAVLAALPISAQVGQGLSDLNALNPQQLGALPNMTPAIAAAVAAKQPFATASEASTFLMDQKLTPDQINAIYEKAFVHVNLNAGTPADFLQIPKIAARIANIELEEYRPWKSWAQFDREIGKYVGAQEANRLKQYVFIPLDLNTAAAADFLTIPNIAPRIANVELAEYRPWKTKEQFDREIGKYVGVKETARLWRFMAALQP